MLKIAMIIPTWGKVCGVADYTKQLIEAVKDKSVKIKVFAEIDEKLQSLLKKDSIDIVHIQYEYSLYDLNILAKTLMELKKQQIPIIATLHSWSSDLGSYNFVVSTMSSNVIVHSDDVQKACIAHGYDREKLVVMPIGSRLFPLHPKEKTKKLFTISGYPCIGFFGFPFPHKGIQNLMDAINELKVYFPEIKGYFFAHYPNSVDEHHPYYAFQKELQSQFDKSKHLIWVKEFLPETAIVNLLHNMDVNILPYIPNNYQGLSSAVKLLLAARRPIITTDNLFFSDLSYEVYKISDAHADTIAAATCQVLLDSTLQERLIAKSKSYLEQNSWDQIGARYRRFYQNLLTKDEGGTICKKL